MGVALVVTHGLGPKMLAATLGTTCALLLTLALGSLAVDAAHLTGFSSDEAVYLGTAAGDISIQGLLLAGLLIGALGVLDDLTVTQASIALALRRADPTLGFRVRSGPGMPGLCVNLLAIRPGIGRAGDALSQRARR